MNSQDSMSPWESSKSTNVGPEKYNVDETYVKDFKMAVMNMLEVRKEAINKPIKEICEKNPKKQIWNEPNKIVQDLQIVESTKETQTKGKLEMKYLELEEETQSLTERI